MREVLGSIPSSSKCCCLEEFGGARRTFCRICFSPAVPRVFIGVHLNMIPALLCAVDFFFFHGSVLTYLL